MKRLDWAENPTVALSIAKRITVVQLISCILPELSSEENRALLGE